MLLPIRPNTPASAIFSALNASLGDFFRASVDAAEFDADLFVGAVGEALWSNEATREKFASLWNALQLQTRVIRQRLCDDFNNHQNQLSNLFADSAMPLPTVPDDIQTSLHALTSHLFSRSSKLVDIELACNETIQGYFNRFRECTEWGNGNVCCACGAEELAPFRADVDPDDQWRGPYDHLLAKEKYPLFGVHPLNLMPICAICNSKAKLAKDLLRDENGNRSRSFFPWSESAHDCVDITLATDEPDSLLPVIRVELISDDPGTQDKLDTWNRVYVIRSRVEGEFAAFPECIASDMGRNTYEGFVTRLQSQANNLSGLCRLKPYNFWRAKLYSAIFAGGVTVIAPLWNALETSQNEGELQAVYGI